MTASRSILSAIIYAVILFLAIWLGVSIATDQTETLIYVLGATVLIVCILLGSRIWMILPLAMALNITLKIPGQPTTFLLAQLLFCGFCLMMFLIRRLPLKLKWTELDFWTLLISLCILQVYLRNPVGLNIFGGSSVGGKPYLIFSITLLTSLILRNLSIPVSGLRWLFRLNIIGGLVSLTISTIGYFIPQIGVWIGSAKAGAMEAGGGVDDGRATRVLFLGSFATNISLWVGSLKSPIKACLHPYWGSLILISLVFAAFSGFRNNIAAVGLAYIVAIAYRGGIRSVFLASGVFAGVIALLAVFNLVTPLPANVQRSLSFLPGTWEDDIKRDAQSSTDWRVEMWEEALFTDFWIQNKFLGDGMGMTREEYAFIENLNIRKIAGSAGSGRLSLQQESMMASNDYHSGPVSTIRVVGYFGLFILLIAQIRLAVHAHRQIKRARNTEWFPLTLLIGIPIIFTPIFFVFIFGSFSGGIDGFLLGVAFLRILQNNLPLPDYIPVNRHMAAARIKST
jgi:hypothetical protein